jgi:rRNA maturation protein Nop10
MKRMKKCIVCGHYTLDDTHCKRAAITPHPAKFSIDDKYADYRRKAKPTGDHDD